MDLKIKTYTKTMIDGKFLIENGYQQGPKLGEALRVARTLEQKGHDTQEILNKLKDVLPQETSKIKLRDQPLVVNLAAKAENQEEEKNLKDSLKKMEELTLCPVVSRAALMPDTCPSGQEYGCIPVGGAIETTNSIIPAAHSADVCCSMRASFFASRQSITQIMSSLEKVTHFGPFSRPRGDEKYHPVLEEPVWSNPFLKGLEGCAKSYLQTQGDGNHFSYLGILETPKNLMKSLEKEGYYEEAKALHKEADAPLYTLVTHHGSRKLGAEIYKRGIEQAIRYTAKVAQGIPKTMAWLNTEEEQGQAYYEALLYAERWTTANHELIHSELMTSLGAKEILFLGNAHNFVWKRGDTFSHGKGATPAWGDDQGRKKIGIIPLNMSSSILITFGENNSRFLSFSPHGAGRNRSRSQTMSQFKDKNQKLDEGLIKKALEDSTKGLDIRWASNRPDISESPLGYKNAKTVEAQLTEYGLATIATRIKPKGCIMAGEFEPIWKKLKKEKKNGPEIV